MGRVGVLLNSPGEQCRSTGPNFRLDGAYAMVIGAGRGLGRAAALALANVGACVYVVSRTPADLLDVCERAARSGSHTQPLVADITNAQDRERLFASLPRLDILVNSAGTNIPEPLLQVSEEHLDQLLNLNVRAAFLAAQQAAGKMLKQGDGGAIINITSQMGHVGAANRSVYCMTKHAVEGMTKAMAIELAPHGIRVNTVAPTFIETQMTRSFLTQKAFHDWVLARLPIGRIGREDEIAGAVVFLASPAASLITGASLLVDGGWTAQ